MGFFTLVGSHTKEGKHRKLGTPDAWFEYAGWWCAEKAAVCVCVHAFVCLHACVCMYMHIHVCSFMCTCAFLYVHSCVCALVCVHVCTQVCVFVHVHVPLCVRRCVYFRCGHLLPTCLRQGLFVLATVVHAPGFPSLRAPQNSPFSAPSPWGTRIMDTPGIVWVLGNSNSGAHPYFTH